MKKVFVTGVNGLLGTNLVHLLLKKGFYVKGLVRDKARYKGNHNPNLQIIEGSLFDDFTKVLSDVDYVVHIAAVTQQNLIHFNDYQEVNCNATVLLFHTAVRCKVRKFVFVSTANTLGYGTLETPGVEKDAIRQPFSASLYAMSKKVAETRLLQHTDKMETIIINPAFMLGAFDTKPSSGRIILMGLGRKIIFYPPGGKNFVHAEDVADGIIKSFKKGRNGEKYIIANENLSYKVFFKKVNAIVGQKAILIRLPKSILTGIGLIGELLRSLRIKTSLSKNNMKILCVNNYYSNKKSTLELGLDYQPVDSAIKDAVGYFRSITFTND